MSARQPTADERAVLDALFAHEFPGVEPLREQWAAALVESNCGCGCGSIAFDIADKPNLRPSPAEGLLPVEAEILDGEGLVVGGLIVFVRGGWLNDVDVHAYEPNALPFPSLDAVRWRA